MNPGYSREVFFFETQDFFWRLLIFLQLKLLNGTIIKFGRFFHMTVPSKLFDLASALIKYYLL